MCRGESGLSRLTLTSTSTRKDVLNASGCIQDLEAERSIANPAEQEWLKRLNKIQSTEEECDEHRNELKVGENYAITDTNKSLNQDKVKQQKMMTR